DRFGIGSRCIAHTPAHTTRRWPMLGGKVGGRAARLVIGDQVDPALTPELGILGAVARDQAEAHRGECRFQRALFRRAEFDELEAIEAERIFEAGHERCSWKMYAAR